MTGERREIQQAIEDTLEALMVPMWFRTRTPSDGPCDHSTRKPAEPEKEESK